jgi:tetratricopeptide (TPR) repeat protein
MGRGLPAAVLLMAAGVGLLTAPLRLAAAKTVAGGQTQSLAQANAALQAGEADKALGFLTSLPPAGDGLALGHNLICRVRFSVEQWDAAAAECAKAVALDGQSSDFHLWLGRALGEKANHASFLSAFSLAKQTRAEFEEAVRLNPRNADALADLGDFDTQAPSVVGGGMDKAQGVAAQLEKVDAARAHELRGRIAEQQKDYAGAEREYKQAIAVHPHPAMEWTTLAGFYARRKEYAEMEAAVHSVQDAVARDKFAAVALYDGAGVLIASKQDPALAAGMLKSYLESSFKSEDAPAFKAEIRLARLEARLGNAAGATQDRTAALALAHDYKPALAFSAKDFDKQQDGAHQQENL